MKQQIFQHTYPNQLTLVAESMPWLESAAFTICVPAGCRMDPADRLGLANFTCEMVQRGCGEYSSRDFLEQLEMLGVDYSSSVSVYHTHFGGAMPAGRLDSALSVFAAMLRQPHLPADQIEDGRQVCFQELNALQDELAQRVLIELRGRFYGQPDGRIAEGTVESVSSITEQDIRQFWKSCYRPNGLIIGVAGKIDWEQLKNHVEQLFGDWASQEITPPPVEAPLHGIHHIPFDSHQTHIALAYPSVEYSHEDYFRARCAVGVLSDGSSSRLFSEIRERRGLCYTVFASCHSTRDRGSVVCYSGTSADRAQETLDVLMDQLLELKAGVTESELDRLKVQIRSGLVMQQESCRSRTGSIASDWFHFDRVRPLDEIMDRILSLTTDSINEYLRSHPAGPFDVVTLGPQPLEFKHGISSTPA